MLIVFIGPPGSGKGTQAKRLLAHFCIPHLSTGEMLRAAKRSDSPLGRLAAQYMDQGRLVPDPLVVQMVTEKLDEPQFAKGGLFDGFPRNIQQAKSLDDTLRKRNQPVDAAVELVADENELVARMLKRAAEEKRVDDTPQTIAHRLLVYRQQTAPLLDYYRAQGKLISVNGMGSPDEVFNRLRVALENRQRAVG